MENETIQFSLSAEEARQLAQLCQTIQNALPGGQVNCQPLATPEQRRRVRDVCLARYREQVGRYPFKLTGCANGMYIVEEERVPILDRSIDIVRNEFEAREKMPLFNRRPH